MTVKDFLKQLGGAAGVARDLGIPYTTVAQWQQSNRVPNWRMSKVADLALTKGIAVPASFERPAA